MQCALLVTLLCCCLWLLLSCSCSCPCPCHCPRLEAAGDGPDAYHKPGSAEADAEFEWVSPNECVRVPYSREWRDLLLLSADYDLCLTGKVEGAAVCVQAFCCV